MLIERNFLPSLVNQIKNNNRTIVFTNGCFDILHAGHVRYLELSKQKGDILILGLNSDASVRKLKGESRPVNNEIDRAIVLSALKSIDYIVIFDEDTPFELIKEIMPDVLTKGADYTIDNVVGADIVMQNGGKVELISFVDGKSTTNIISKMRC
jgi:rfaE bifunctional protein nucleotidyltransferase chain/domain